MGAERTPRGATVDVPLNTMLADLDATLRRLLRDGLRSHGFGGVNVAFDAPTRDWAAALSGPTVSLFLYDLGESNGIQVAEWLPQQTGGRLRDVRPPLQLRASYAVTAFTRGIEDEHRLLSQSVGILYAHPQLPRELLGGTLAEHCGDSPPHTALARGGERRTDLWSAIGGQYKPSVDYSVVLPFPSGRARERGPQVRERVVHTGVGEVREARHLLAGRVLGPGGDALAGCRIALPDAGRSAVSDEHGGFRLDGVPSGSHRCVARAENGARAEAVVELPGPEIELRVPRRPSPTRSTACPTT